MKVKVTLREGDYIPNGVALKWVRGPVIYFTPSHRKWRIKFRLRLWRPRVWLGIQHNPIDVKVVRGYRA